MQQEFHSGNQVGTGSPANSWIWYVRSPRRTRIALLTFRYRYFSTAPALIYCRSPSLPGGEGYERLERVTNTCVRHHRRAPSTQFQPESHPSLYKTGDLPMPIDGKDVDHLHRSLMLHDRRDICDVSHSDLAALLYH